jgi:hypothetical protein
VNGSGAGAAFGRAGLSTPAIATQSTPTLTDASPALP